MLLLTFGLAACSNDQEGEAAQDKAVDSDDDKTITIGQDPYDFATVPAYLSKEILEREGYDVEIEVADVGILYQSLSNGDIDAFVDVWAPGLQKEYLEKYEGDFKIAGTLYSDMPYGVAVPDYLEDIDSIEDVKEHPEKFDGKIYAIEPGSGMSKTTERMVDEYNMADFEVQNSSSQAMVAKAVDSFEDGEPIVFDAWRPHPMFMKMDLKFLDDPKDVWHLDDVHIGVTNDLENASPFAYTVFANMDLTLDMVEKWQNSMKFDDEKPEDLAEEWIDDHPDKVDEWLEK
ncbi:glycine betaine ABC transporter substrate-binding protein [Barrientosiimonas marina]|uniref:Glycine betaine ABC transporter substrate-binding protein n=1 Tax=Lentibacillus kimchii TaxID=1542911 RepID=A0ABW2UWP2_9BACI